MAGRRYLFFGIIALVLLVDQAAKGLVRLFMYQGESITIVPSVLSMTCVFNTGAAFGLFPRQTGFLIAVTVILTAAVLWGYCKLSLKGGPVFYGVALIVGGALGNLLDRIRYGYVVDFLDFHFWPVFNLADTAIVLGGCLLLRDLLAANTTEKDTKT
jgi:signal peptidase II